jgi:hypothetical protein
VGDVGAKIGLHFVTCDGRYDTPVDLSDATLTFIFRASDGEQTVIRDADIVPADFDDATGDKTDGRVMYVTVPGFFTVEGYMEVQGIADFGGGERRHYTTISRFHVGRSLMGDADVLTHENGSDLQLEDGT